MKENGSSAKWQRRRREWRRHRSENGVKSNQRGGGGVASGESIRQRKYQRAWR
jgi:hypothetical protein